MRTQTDPAELADLTDLTVVASTATVPVLAEVIAERRRLGQDGYDEMWDGVYHVAATSRFGHGYVQMQLGAALLALAGPRGLFVTGPVNIGSGENDHRVPDAAVLAEDLDLLWHPTALMVVEVLSPKDETYAKFGFYYARGVGEVLVADPAGRTLTLYAHGREHFTPTNFSGVLDAPLQRIAAGITWPGHG